MAIKLGIYLFSAQLLGGGVFMWFSYIGGTPKQLTALPKGISLIGANSSQTKIYTIGSALERAWGKRNEWSLRKEMSISRSRSVLKCMLAMQAK